MKRQICEVRIRPQRVAVLVSKAGSHDDLLLAIKFLSHLWGGRFCQILAVEEEGDEHTLKQLTHSRPDFVYMIGVTNKGFHEAIRCQCQPRGIGILESAYVEKLYQSIENHITVGHVINHIRRTPLGRYQQERTLKFFNYSDDWSLKAFAAALYGIQYADLSPESIAHEKHSFDESATIIDLLNQHISFITAFERCWLDINGHALTPLIIGQMGPPPTIVVVGSEIPDLALFWNLRAATDNELPNWIIPIPLSSLKDEGLCKTITNWLHSITPILGQPNFCNIVSSTVDTTVLQSFAASLQEEFNGSDVKHVDVVKEPILYPLVIGFDRTEQILLEKHTSRISLHPPSPTVLGDQSSQAWMLDLERDVETRRAVEELELPHRLSSLTVLAAPCSTSLSITRYCKMGIGPNTFNLRCSSSRATHFCVPTAEEVLSENLREYGVVPVRDEKRSSYLPAIKMFGGLQQCADAMTGKRAKILQELMKGPRSVEDLKSSLKLGKGTLAELDPPKSHENILKHLDKETQRIVGERLRRHRDSSSPDSNRLDSLLEFWADRGILHRQWKIGPCSTCMQTYWEPHLDISKSISCPGCGNRVLLPPSIPMGYSLHRAVKHAMDQGLGPVVLTARFLRSLTNRGYLWLPGMKYTWDSVKGDIDVLASCDGYLVFAECKTLSMTQDESKVWADIVKQFEETIKVASQCQAKVVILSSLCEEYPESVRNSINQLVPEGMGHLLLTRDDLEAGHRKILMPDGKTHLWQTIGDVVSPPKLNNQSQSGSEPRTIKTSYSLRTFVGPESDSNPDQETTTESY